MPLLAGETFERYTIEERIGRGGLGEVYRAFDTRLHRRVAIKIIRTDKTDEITSARFLREARVAASLGHPNTVAIHDLGESRGTLYLVMELVRGTPLRAFVGDASIPLEVKLDWLKGIARGLGAAHEAGIVHRDVKPGNIMITTESVAKVLDFGLAKPMGDDTTKVGFVVGTPRYMAPEQREGSEADARSDQYSFGVTAYELLANVHPDARRQSLRAFLPDVDPTITSSIDRMMAVDPQMRFPSMFVASSAIEAYARTYSISTTIAVAANTGDADLEEPSTTEQLSPSLSRFREDVPAPPQTAPLPSTLPPPDPYADEHHLVATTPPEHTAEMATRVRALDPRAEALMKAFAEAHRIESPGDYAIELRTTEQTSHPLLLVPRNPAYAAIVMGSVSIVRSAAELRAFDYVGLMHTQRRSTRAFVARKTYESIVKHARQVLKDSGIASIAVVAAPPELRAASSDSRVPPSTPPSRKP